MEKDRVADHASASGGNNTAISHPQGSFGGEGHHGFDNDCPRSLQDQLVPRGIAVDGELQGVGIAVGDVGASLGQALAPGAESRSYPTLPSCT